mgnify:CR=1 FL=1
MNTLVYSMVLLIIFSCKSNSLAQEKSLKDKKSDIENVKDESIATETKNSKTIIGDGLQIDTVLAPGSVHVSGSIISFHKNTTICNRPYKAALTIRIENVLKSGPGIIHMLSPNQEITLGFMNGMYTKDLSDLEDKMTTGKNLSMMLKEGLCFDMNTNNLYEIMQFEIQ